MSAGLDRPTEVLSRRVRSESANWALLASGIAVLASGVMASEAAGWSWTSATYTVPNRSGKELHRSWRRSAC